METQSFIDYIIESVTEHHWSLLTEEFKAELIANWNKKQEQYLEDAYYKGYCEGKRVGLNYNTK